MVRRFVAWAAKVPDTDLPTDRKSRVDKRTIIPDKRPLLGWKSSKSDGQHLEPICCTRFIVSCQPS